MALGAQTAEAPASAKEDVFKQRVEITRVVQKEDGSYRVKGRIHSPDKRCRKGGRGVVLWRTEGDPVPDWGDHDLPTRRGKFSFRVPQSEEGNTFRAIARKGPNEGGGGLPPQFGYKCKGDESRRFTLLPAS
jgi:hypothetical protein